MQAINRISAEVQKGKLGTMQYHFVIFSFALLGFRVNAALELMLHVALELMLHGLSVIILIVRACARD